MDQLRSDKMQELKGLGKFNTVGIQRKRQKCIFSDNRGPKRICHTIVQHYQRKKISNNNED